MAVAVHPTDERYAALVGKMIKLPITGREIPIVADEHADPELGSGAVKVTPGHDFNDYEVGKRAGFKPADMLNMFDAAARVVQSGGIPDALIGLDRFDARKAVVDLLDAEGALVKVEDRQIATPYGDRSNVVIEPWLTDQWYVDAATLVKPVIEATRAGKIKIVPESWSKTWFNWLENIQPWCVSRQLWWGHRIPAWFDECRQYLCRRNACRGPIAGRRWRFPAPGRRRPRHLVLLRPLALRHARLARKHPRPPAPLPQRRAHLRLRHPLLLGCTHGDAGDGVHEEVPWKTLYLHGLVRDAHGAKMSKSKGNTVDPLGLIDRYGADALRFTMAAMESQGRDIKLDEKRVEGYRNFATKLWNAARFLQGNGVGASASIAAPEAKLPVNRWIIGEVVATLDAMNKAIADLRFDDMAAAIYHFTWGTFCDWYVELVKSDSHDPESEASEEKQVARAEECGPSPLGLSTRSLSCSIPLMPFVTEELWSTHGQGDRDDYPLIIAKWPDARAQGRSRCASRTRLVDRTHQEIRSARPSLPCRTRPKSAIHVTQLSDFAT